MEPHDAPRCADGRRPGPRTYQIGRTAAQPWA